MASHVFFSLEPSLLPVAAAAAPAAGDGGRRRGRRRADGRFRPSPAIHPGRPELASHLMLPNELDIQVRSYKLACVILSILFFSLTLINSFLN